MGRLDGKVGIVLGAATTDNIGQVIARRYARHAGIKELDGDVLRENEPMLKLSQRLGFIQSDVPDDDSIVKVTLTL